MPRPVLYGPDERPLPPAVLGGSRPRRSMAAFDAGDPASQDLGSWHPYTYSPDSAYSPERQKISDRLHDLVRNDGWASGAVTSYVNTAIGAALRFNSAPDAEALGIDAEAAFELGRQIEGGFRAWANDPRKTCDVQRRQRLAGLFALLFRHRIVDGECLAALAWRPGRGSRFATALQVLHPARLSNPQERPDDDGLRGGVELDDDGGPVAYHFRRAHPGDRFLTGTDYWTWDRVEAAWHWGRPQVVHHFRPDEAGQTRGVSPFAPITRRAKMNQRYEGLEIQAAVANAALGAYIETSLPPEAALELLEDGSSKRDAFEGGRLGFYEKAPVRLGDFRIPVLPIGDRVNFATPARPNREAGEFVKVSLRNFAAALGLNPSTISRDYSETNYSSERAALLEAWRTITVERAFFGADVGGPILLAWLEEAIERGTVTLPRGAPSLWEAPAAYIAGEWIGPGRGWVDPVKEASAAKIRMDSELSTLQQEAAEQGQDYQDLLRQQARERRERQQLGLPEPQRAALPAQGEERDEKRGREP